jgi:hypothetical protein
VVVCHHVVYNVAELRTFLRALAAHARVRVVLELTERHPLSGLAPLWSAIHGIERPDGPTAADALDTATELGYTAQIVRFERPTMWDSAPVSERVAFARRQLCVGPEHDDEIARYFRGIGGSERRCLATIWWDSDDGSTRV